MRFLPVRVSLHRAVALLIALCVCCLPAMALAFDCTPISTLTNDGNAYAALIGVDAIPGEPVCAFDYTGWSFHVVEFSIPQPALQIVFSASNAGGAVMHLLLFEQCNPAACLYTGTGSGVIEDLVCLDAGTYTMVQASPPGSSGVYNMATASVDECTPVAAVAPSWGTLKSGYR